MSLSCNLYYYANGAYQDISNYVSSITNLQYGIGKINKGSAIKLRVTLDANCPYYGTKNIWKLKIGDDYVLLGVPKDGIENISNKQFAVTLIDYFFAEMDKKASLKIAGEGDATSLAGEAISMSTINDILVNYKTDQENFDADNFSSRDGTYFYDGQGNTIGVYGGEGKIRYKTKGAMKALGQAEDLGQVYVSLRDIINNIATAEGFSMDIDFGAEEASSYSYGDVSGCSKVWDCKVINGNIITLLSVVGAVNLLSFANDADGDTQLDTLSWDSRDWDEDSDGIDFIAYQIFPDYRNNCCYIAGWHCAAYVHDAGTNSYIFRILKISVASDGTLTQDWDNKDTGGTDFVTQLLDPADRASMQARDYRFDSDKNPLPAWDNLTWYCDDNLAKENKYRIIYRKGSGSTDMFVIDPDLWQAGSANDIYTYTLNAQSGWLVPDWMNGSVVHLYYDTAYKKDFYRVNMAILTAGYTVSGQGGTIHTDDDPLNNTVPPIGIWREPIIYTNTIPNATGEFYYHLPQVPNGHLVREGVYNNYIELKDDYLGNNYAHDVTYGGSAWDESIDRALVWHTDDDAGALVLYWDIHDNFTYKRLYLYQPCVYPDRKTQFLDALLSHGFFYEQRNGNVRLTRIKWDSTDLFVAHRTDGLFAYNFNGITLTKIDGIDDGGDAYDACFDGTYIFLANDTDGLRAYTYNGTTLTNVGHIYDGGNYYGVWTDGTYIYAACGTEGLKIYTFDGTTFTNVGSQDDGGTYYNISGDDKNIYVACGTSGLRVYTFDGTTITHIDNIDDGGTARSVHIDGNNIFLANDSDGIRVYLLVNNTLINIAHKDNGAEAWDIWTSMDYIYLANQTGGLYIYTFDGTTLTVVDNIVPGGGATYGVWTDSEFVYLADSSNGVLAYKFDGTTITNITSSDDGATYPMKICGRSNISGSNLGSFTDDNILNKVKIDGFTEYAESYNLNVLDGIKSKGIGTQEKEIKTTIGEYGWFSMWQMDYYSDWVTKINSKKPGYFLYIDLKDFYDIAATRMPLLGDKITYNAIEYIILSVDIDIENWIITLTLIRN
jgi:hypothetical protein